MMRWVLLACTYCIAEASLSQYDRPQTQLSEDSARAAHEALALALVKSASLGGNQGQRLFAELTSVQSASCVACHSPCTPMGSPCCRG